MMTQTKGKIYLSEERGCSELAWFRSYSTFNFGDYQHVHKAPFGSLYVLNEDTLGGGNSLMLKVEESSDVVLLPVVGAVTYTDELGQAGRVEAGEVKVLPLLAGTTLMISNPYATELVRFLQLWIKTPGNLVADSPHREAFNLDNNRNRLLEIFGRPRAYLGGAGPYRGLIGQFVGRQEAVYTVSHAQNGVFVFVVEGDFEVAHRLLGAGDGLALWELRKVELEALSNDAIVLVVELPLADGNN